MDSIKALYKEDIAELQRMLFEEVTRYEYEVDYKIFVAGYMNSHYRRMLDMCSARIANMTWDELLSYIKTNNSGILERGNTDIDRLQAGWIGRIYSLVQYESGLSSSVIYEKINYDRMKQLFIPLHTIAEELAVKKLLACM